MPIPKYALMKRFKNAFSIIRSVFQNSALFGYKKLHMNRPSDNSLIIREELSSEQEALLGIADFCASFSEADIQYTMNIAAKTCLTTDAVEFATPGQRQDIRYVFEHVSKLFPNVYKLN